MGGVTNELVKKSKEISENFSNTEYDTLVCTGEQVSCSLIAGRLIHKGFKARSWLAWQIPIITKGVNKNSRIHQINKKKIVKYLNEAISSISSYEITFNFLAFLNFLGSVV